jgi:hypothetical protein
MRKLGFRDLNYLAQGDRATLEQEAGLNLRKSLN